MSPFDHHQYARPAAMPLVDRQWPDRVIECAPEWCSVDLRDGNQALIEPMSVAKKIRLWDLLVTLGFKQIEVGFPAASGPDYDFVRALIDGGRIPDDVTIQVLVQAREELITHTFAALAGVRRAIVHVYNSTSTVQRERVFRADRDGITAIARHGAEWVAREAARHPGTKWTFEYSPESFTGTELDYAVAVCSAVLDIWQPTPEQRCIINLPATVEVTSPNVFADRIEYMHRNLPRRDGVILSVHTHNDRGCAVAAGELAVMAGAQRVEGTLFGNGERTGNMDIVTMAMNLYSQGIDPELNLSNPDEIIAVATECTGIDLHPRHPWVGDLVYTAFSGSHQDAIRKCLHAQGADEPWQVAYLPIDPHDIGRDYQAVIRINSQSGKGGVAYVLERDYGYRLPRWLQIEFARVVQKVSEEVPGELDSTSIQRLFMEYFVTDSVPQRLVGYQLQRNNNDAIEVRIVDGCDERVLRGEGNGTISAFVDAFRRDSGQVIHVVDYSEHAIGEGTDAEAIAYVYLSVDSERIAAAAIDHDTVSALMKAVLSALNRSSSVLNSHADRHARRNSMTGVSS